MNAGQKQNFEMEDSRAEITELLVKQFWSARPEPRAIDAAWWWWLRINIQPSASNLPCLGFPLLLEADVVKRVRMRISLTASRHSTQGDSISMEFVKLRILTFDVGFPHLSIPATGVLEMSKLHRV